MDIVASLGPRPGVRVVGTMTRSILSALSPGLLRCGVRFRPGVLPVLLRRHAREFSDAAVDIGAAALNRFACAETPGDFARAARFRRALHEGRLRGERTWADVAAECGYYDQAHLVRDFHDFAGAAPGRFSQGTKGA